MSSPEDNKNGIAKLVALRQQQKASGARAGASGAGPSRASPGVLDDDSDSDDDCKSHRSLTFTYTFMASCQNKLSGGREAGMAAASAVSEMVRALLGTRGFGPLGPTKH